MPQTSRVPLRGLALALLVVFLAAAPAAADHVELLWLSLGNRLPSTAERIDITVSGFSIDCPVHFAEPVVAGRTVRLDGAQIVTVLPCPPGEWKQSFTVQPLPAGGYTVEVWIDGTLHLTDGFAVREEDLSLTFHGGAFTATAEWKVGESAGVGHAIQLGADSGAFWFFGPGNVEVTLKVLDGRAVNGRYWVFIANMSNVEHTVTVTQCPTNPLLAIPCVSKSYRNPPSQNRNFLDTAAF